VRGRGGTEGAGFLYNMQIQETLSAVRGKVNHTTPCFVKKGRKKEILSLLKNACGLRSGGRCIDEKGCVSGVSKRGEGARHKGR